MRILIRGYYGRVNYGDEALLSEVVKDIRSILPDCDIIVSSHDSTVTRSLHDLKSYYVKNPFAAAAATLRSDVVIWGGGGHTYNRLDVLLYNLFLALLAKMTKKKILAYGIGVERVLRSTNRALARVMFSLLDMIIVRDEASKGILVDLGVTKEIHVTADHVVGAQYEPDAQMAKCLANFKGPAQLVGISFLDARNAPRYAEISKHYVGLVEHCVELGLKVVLIAMSPGEGDCEVVDAIVQQLSDGSRSEVSIVRDISSLNEIMSVARSIDFAIGMRLHFLIFAAINRKPLAAISRSPKVTSIVDALGQDIICHVDEFSPSDLYHNLDLFLSKQPAWTDSQKRAFNELKRIEQENLLLLASFLRGYSPGGLEK